MKSKLEDPSGSLVQAVGSAIKFASTSKRISDRGAHEIRKSLKKARAALRLLRPVLGDAVYRRENTVLKNASRSVSPLRDARAQLDVVDSLRKHRGQRSAMADLRSLKVRLRQRLARMRQEISRSARPVRRTVEELKKSRQRLLSLRDTPLPPDQITTGLRKMYRQGRRALAAAKNETSATTLHELRKEAKYLANAVGIVGDGSGSAGKAAAKRVERVADWLGEDHDLAVLTVDLRRTPRLLGAPEKSALRRLIGKRRSKLQKRSLRVAVEIYAKKPTKVFA